MLDLEELWLLYLNDHPRFQLLPETSEVGSNAKQRMYTVVLFRAKNSSLNQVLVQMINETRRMYVSGAKWENQPASRIAVSNWQVEPSKDLPVVKEVLENVTMDWDKTDVVTGGSPAVPL